jgi:hypothetical protein
MGVNPEYKSLTQIRQQLSRAIHLFKCERGSQHLFSPRRDASKTGSISTAS